MGILNFNTLVKDLCPDAISIAKLSNWKGGRVAIDLNNLLYIHMSVAWRQVVNDSNIPYEDPDMVQYTKIYLENIRRMIMRFLRNKITPVIVCDGPPPPEKDAIARKKRQAKKTEDKDLYDELHEVLLAQDPLTVEISDISRLKTYLLRRTPVTTTDIETIKAVLSGIGIPVLQSTAEAETLCSLMCRTGLVDLVYSTDTDNLVYGCPIMMTGFEGTAFDPETNERVDQVKIYNFNKIIERLDVTYEQFVDICIMSGCDYNHNIPGIGVKTSYKLIKEYGSIDNLADKYDVTCLNHVKCRELFADRTYQELCENSQDKINVDLNSLSEYARDCLEPYGVDYWISDLIEIYRDFPQNPVMVTIHPRTVLPEIVIVLDD